MKFCLLCFLTSTLVLSLTAGKDENPPFRIMCYNVENYFDCVDDSLTNDEEYLPGGMRGWGYNRYIEKQANIARVIVAIGGWNPPAIVGLCEVESRKAILDLTRYGILKNLGYAFIHYESPDFRGIDVALLYQPDLFHVINSRPIDINFPEDKTSTTRDVLYVKGVVTSGDTLHVAVCHFPSRLGGEMESSTKRIHVATIIKHHFDSILLDTPDANIVIMGDFNDYPDNDSMQKVLGAAYPSPPYKSSSLYNLMFPLHMEGVGTHKHEGNWGTLDQFIVSGNLLNQQSKLHTNKTAVAIFNVDFLSEQDVKYLGKKPLRTYVGMKYNAGYSDHYPIYLDFWY